MDPNPNRPVDHTANLLAWAEGMLRALAESGLTDEEIAATMRVGHNRGADPALIWLDLDYGEEVVALLHDRLTGVRAALARQRLRGLSPAERDELPAGALLGLGSPDDPVPAFELPERLRP